MADLEYTVTNQGISTSKTSRLVSGTIGVYTVKFTFNNVWDGLEKWATFDPIPGTPYKQPLDANGECTIPGEVMGGVYLRIGVFGLAEGQAYPTIWASKLPLEEGCFANVPPSDWPEPSPLLEDVVKVSEQTFTDAQKAQARTNIGAAGSAEMTTALAGKVDKPVGATEGNVAVIGSNNNIIDSGKSFADIYDSAMIHKTASGAIVTIEDGADDVPIKQMTAQIVPIQAGTGDPSPSNVRAITGWTGANVYHVGKNLLYCSMGSGSYRGMTYTKNADGSYTISNTSTNYGTFLLTTSGVETKLKEGDYTLSVGSQFNPSTTTYNFSFEVYYNGSWVEHKFQSAGVNKETFHASAIRNVKLFVNNGIATNFNIYPQLEYGTQQTAYEPYAITTYTVNFPTEAGTVYGGELTVNEDGSGTLTVDKALISLNGSEAWATGTATYGSYFTLAKSLPFKTFSIASEFVAMGNVCNQFMPSAVCSTASPHGTFWWNGSATGLRFVDTATNTTLDAWKTRCNTNPIQIAGLLASPTTYTLTAPQVSTLLGLNNIWADTGDIAVEYHADPTIFVEEKTKAIKQSIAYVQDDFTAVQPYVVNDLVYVGDTLYIVTSAIAQAATMTPNTNCAETTLNAVIKSLR